MALAAASGLASFDQASGEFLDLSNELAEIIRRDNTAFISRVGISGEATETSHSWMEDALNPNTATGAEAIDDSETTIDVATGHGVRFKVGTIFKVAYPGLTEVFQVTAVTTDALTVTRGYGSTTAESAAAAGTTPTLQIIAHLRQESSDAPDDESRARTKVTNYTQIFQKGIMVSHTMRSVLQAGVADEFTFQIARRMLEIERELDSSVIAGIKSASAGSDTVYRSMGGLIEFASQATGNTTTTAEALTLTVVNDMCKQIWDDGGVPNFILVGGKQKRKISAFDQSARRSSYDGTVAGYVVDKVITDLGFVLDVITDPWMPDDVCIIGDLGKIRIMPLRNDSMRAEELAKTGRSYKAQVTGQYTVEIRNAIEAFAYHNNLS
jgi:hypothetical protein